jgi:hypothetical protein
MAVSPRANRTLMGIAIHNATSAETEGTFIDLAAGIRQDASGIFGTTVQLGDLVSFRSKIHHRLDLPVISRLFRL